MSWLDDASDNDVLLLVGGMIPMPTEDDDTSNEEAKPEERVQPGVLTRDWAKWHLEHPYVKHPRRKHFTETEHHAHRPSGLPERSIIRNAEDVKAGDRLSGYSSPVDTVETSQYGMVKIKLRDGSSFQRRQGAQVSVFPGAEPEPSEPSEPSKPDTGNPHEPGSEEHAEYERGYKQAQDEAQNYHGRAMTSHEAQAHANGSRERALDYAAEAIARDKESGTGHNFRVASAGQEGQAKAYSHHAAAAEATAAQQPTTNPYPSSDPLHDQFQSAYEVKARDLGRRTYTPTQARQEAELERTKAVNQENLGTGRKGTGPELAARSLGNAAALSDYADYYEAELEQLAPVTKAHHEAAIRMAMDMETARNSFHETRMQRAIDQVRSGATFASTAEAATDAAVNKFWRFSGPGKEQAAKALTEHVAKLKPGELLDAPTVYANLGRDVQPSDIRLATNDINKALKTFERNDKLADDARKVDDWMGQIAHSMAYGTPLPGDLKFGRRRYKVPGDPGYPPTKGYSAEHAAQIPHYIGMDGVMDNPDAPIGTLESVSLRDIALEQKIREKGQQIADRIDADDLVKTTKQHADAAEARWKAASENPLANGSKKAQDLRVGDHLDQFSRKGTITKIEDTTDTNYLGNPTPAYQITWTDDATGKEKTAKVIHDILSTVSTPERQELEDARQQRKLTKTFRDAALLQATKRELAAERSMGGGAEEHPIKSRIPGDKRVEKLRTALGVYPTDWIQRSMATGKSLELGRSLRRANYSLGTINISQGESNATNVHELGHHMQRQIAKLSQTEHVQLLRRAGRDRLQGMRSLAPNYGYGSDEKSRADEFVDPYVGKSYGQYASSPHEVFTVGVQSVLGSDGTTFGRLIGNDGKVADPELRAFTLGALATLGPADVKAEVSAVIPKADLALPGQKL